MTASAALKPLLQLVGDSDHERLRILSGITTIAINEQVMVNVKSKSIDTIHQWAGKVLAVDVVGIRLLCCWYRIALSMTYTASERVIPWRQIEDIKIVEPG